MRLQPFLLLTVTLVAYPAAAQPVVRIPSSATCADCRIVLDPIARLGSVEDPVALPNVARVLVDSRGWFYVAPTFQTGQIAVYRPDGSFHSLIGRAGQGPGEFGRISTILMTSGDTLHVFDGIRHTVLRSDGAFVRLQNLPFIPYDRLYVPGYGLFVQYLEAGSGRSGHAFHLVDEEGSLVRSFGSVSKPVSRDRIDDAVRRLGPGRGNNLWSSRVNEYLIELWSPEGEKRLTVIRDAEWFRPWTGVLAGEPLLRRPRPAVNRVWEDEAGRLWVMLTVAAHDWRPQREMREGSVWHTDANALYDTIIEVLDVQNGRVIARARYDRLISGLHGSPYAHSSRLDAAGNYVLDVWRVSLRTSNQRR